MRECKIRPWKQHQRAAIARLEIAGGMPKAVRQWFTGDDEFGTLTIEPAEVVGVGSLRLSPMNCCPFQCLVCIGWCIAGCIPPRQLGRDSTGEARQPESRDRQVSVAGDKHRADAARCQCVILCLQVLETYGSESPARCGCDVEAVERTNILVFTHFEICTQRLENSSASIRAHRI